MFIDLVGSTPIAEQLGPERFRSFLRTTQAAITAAVSRHSGHIAQYYGDGTLTLFGFPRALDDHARYAINSGLDLLEHLAAGWKPAELGDDRSLAIRIACHSGPLITDRAALNSGGTMSPAEGATISIAARLQGEALPNQLLISGDCHRLTEGFFETRFLGDRNLRGIAKPIAVHEVLTARRRSTLFSARQQESRTPHIGRASELHYLKEELSRARTVRSRAVLVTGEPGIGKSRLLDELRQYLVVQGIRHNVYQCEEFARNTDFAPFTRNIRYEIEALSALGAERKPITEGDITGFLNLRNLPADDLTIASLASAIGHKMDTRPQADTVAIEIKRRLKQLIISYLMDEPSRHACLIIEDIHWADPSTLELLEDLIGAAAGVGTFLAMTARSDGLDNIALSNRTSVLQLSPLSEEDAALIVAKLDPLKRLSLSSAREIVARSGGVPLFIEECCKAISISSQQSQHGSEEIPDRLRGVIWKRLDQLGLAKWTAQLAAVGGMTGSVDLLEEVSRRVARSAGVTAAVSTALTTMLEADLIQRTGDSREFAFRHALIRDAAYESLTTPVRAQWHHAYAEVLQEWRSQGILNAPLEVVAQHHLGARDFAGAADAVIEAGRLAVGRFANAEAIALFGKAIQFAAKIDDHDVARRKELQIRGLLNAPLIAADGWASSSLEENNKALLTIARKYPDATPSLESQRMLFNVSLLRGDRNGVRLYLDGLASFRGKSADIDMIVDRCNGARLMYIDGDVSGAREMFIRSLSGFDAARHRVGMGLYDLDGEVAVRSSLAWLAWFDGSGAKVADQAVDVIATARRIGHPFTLAYALCIGGSALVCAEEEGRVQVLSDEAFALAEKHEMHYWRAYSRILLGASLIPADPENALSVLNESRKMYAATGAQLIAPWIDILQARALLRLNRRSETERLLQGVRHQDVSLFRSLADRMLGEL